MPDNRLCVLVVDNDDQDKEIVLRLLKDLGISRIEEAEDGPSGLIAFKKFSPGLVISDTHMPGYDGDDLCRRIRRTDIGRYVGIIGTSDCNSVYTRECWKKAKSDCFFYKDLFYFQRFFNKIVPSILRKYSYNISL
jgi:CheY-like chemotaxis protein